MSKHQNHRPFGVSGRGVGLVGGMLTALVLLAAPALASASAMPDQPGTTPSVTGLSVAVADPSGPGSVPVVGDLATFDVVVTDGSGSATSNPTGVVDVFLGSPTGPEMCEAALSANAGSDPLSSSGQCAAPVSEAGTDTYFAVYQGDPTFASSEESAGLSGVDSATTTSVSVTGGGAGATVGDTLDVTADVLASSAGAAGAPTGTVAFLDDDTPIGSCAAVSVTAGAGASAPSTAACAFEILQSANAVTAVYSGDSADGSSASAVPAVVEAQPATATLSLSTSDATPVAGDVLTIDATLTGVSGVTPSQSIAVDAKVGAGSPQLLTGCSDQSFPAQATASCTYPITSTHALEFTAFYAGDAGYGPATAAPLDLTPSAATPTVSISTSDLNPVAGGSDSVTALVTGNALVGAPTGAITVSQAATVLTGCGAASTVGDTESVTCPVTYTGAGDVQFSAQVAAGAGYTTASGTATRDVAQATPVVTVAAPVATVGTTVQATALVTGAADITPGPSGSIELFANGKLLRTCTLTQPTSTSEQASCSFTYENTGAVTFTATVLADANYASASAVPIVETGTPAATTTALTSFTVAPAVGGSIQLKAAVSAPKNAVMATGSVEFFESTAAGHPYTAISTCGSDGSVGLDLAGDAGCTVTLSTTTSTFLATYSGDTDYLHSTSAVYRPVISRAVATMVVAKLASGSAPVPGSYVHIEVTMTGVKSAGSPTGTLSIKGPAGSKCATSCTGNTLHGLSGDQSQAEFAMSFASPGLAKVTVTYGGSTLYLPASGSTQFDINKPPKAPSGSPRLLGSSGGKPQAAYSRRPAAVPVDRSIAISRRSWSHA